MLNELLPILRCPACASTTGGELRFTKNMWLVCKDCQRKYPIINNIPIMLVEEGNKWIKTPDEKIPQNIEQ